MSVEATGWAFRQKVPPKPKMVLMALADQTDEKSGRVCYGKTDMAHLADKASVPERSLYRYINALMRNGYLIRESGKGKGHANAYWLRLDRPMAESLNEWEWANDPSDEDHPQDVVEGSATVADPLDGENDAEGLPPIGRGGLPLVADQESTEVPKNVDSRARGNETRSFSRKAQDLELEDRAIKAQAEKENARVFVYENSEAWKAWCRWRGAHGQVPSLPTCTHIVDDRPKRGWWMPTLFPPSDQPKSTDPPKESSAA